MSIQASGQLTLDTTLVLDGPDGGDRQVHGLATPLRHDAAMSANAMRHTTANYTVATGTSQLVGELAPPPAQIPAGMVITFVPESANSAGATLDLNGTGAYPLVKEGHLPLDSADLAPGIPVRCVFDGDAFRVLNHLPRRCPVGYTAITREYCIADSSRDTTTFYNASVRCAADGLRLCSFNEWIQACQLSPGFFSTVPSGEWVDDSANHASTAKLVGAGDNGTQIGAGCNYGSLSVPTGLFRYRCCSNR